MGSYTPRRSAWTPTPLELQHGHLRPSSFSMDTYAPRRRKKAPARSQGLFVIGYDQLTII